MLLPSAFACDSSQPPLTRLQSALFASPPASPPQLSTQNALGNLFSTCRNLQSLLAAPAPIEPAGPVTPPASSHNSLLTPPMAHAPSPMKLRLRSRKTDASSTPSGADHNPITMRKRIVKRAPPRGANKRRRGLDDDMGREDGDSDSDLEHSGAEDYSENTNNLDGGAEEQTPPRPHTPKRARIAPEVLPLGLERSDFHTLHAEGVPDDSRAGGTDVQVEADGEAWSAEEDRMLVELVLEKLKLSKSDWQDCARSLGKDRGSVGRRWKSLMLHGEVGLKTRSSSRRSRIHGTWR
ncbi:DNA-binding protein [Pleurostoma richardsiae]|uniref:DNA-binding protein n=1 Tax=Pleurostoma richardsiae TaxID=41990 RepID=A0AA38S2H3_9PEZI|nr:DNA-binding protein [Pleurostoma richardsiae]